MSVNIRNTEVQTFGNAKIFLPNSTLIANQVTNWTHRNDVKIRRDVLVGVAYGSDRDMVRRLLLQAASESPRVLGNPPPSVVFTDFGPSALEYRLRVWVTEPEDSVAILSEVRERIDSLFREHGVEIAFPQTDVHLRSAPALKPLLDNAPTARPAGRTTPDDAA
jgi:small-conductance mechanosensitive channel